LIIDHCTNSESTELAKFILSRIMKNQNDVEQMEKELDNNERLASEFIFFFIDTGWISRNVDGTYAITMKCRSVLEQRN
jgi:hypothetical protein